MEGEILRGAARAGVFGPTPARVDVASRTDRGVSARGNALVLDSPLSGSALLGALNSVAPEIFFTAATEVDGGFRPRAARSRTYHYLESKPVGPADAYRRVAARAVGAIDVRSFGRGIPPDGPMTRTITRFDVRRSPAGLRLELEAPSFVWGMVRKLVAATRLVVSGDLPAREFEAALAGRRRLTVPLADPAPLVLWEVEYDRPWTVTLDALPQRKIAYFEAERIAASERAVVLESLVGPAGRRVGGSIPRGRPSRTAAG